MKEKDLIEIIALIKENDPETALKILKKYGGERYMKGATNFAKLVRDMRFKQKDYARDQSSLTMKASQKLEKQVDRTIEVILK